VLRRLLHEPVAVGFAALLEDPGMGLADHAVPGLRIEIDESPERVDRPFDPLARAEEAPGQDRRPDPGRFAERSGARMPSAIRETVVGRAVRNEGDAAACSGRTRLR
jgi:hypothetical protein